MTAVLQSATETTALLGTAFPGCVVANDNSPRQSVVAGPVAEIEKFESALTAVEAEVARREGR